MDSSYPAVIVQPLRRFLQFGDWQLLLWESLPILPFDAGGHYTLDRLVVYGHAGFVRQTFPTRCGASAHSEVEVKTLLPTPNVPTCIMDVGLTADLHLCVLR
jgi:hypothetical protein